MSDSPFSDLRSIKTLREIMSALRTPVTGCPWDLEQNFATIAPYTIEEAYEVADAIEREDWAELKGELGDLLLQTVYHTAMGEEAGLFTFQGVADAISDKMVARHPHVFGAESRDITGEDAVLTSIEVTEGDTSTIAFTFQIAGPMSFDGTVVVSSR